VADEDNEDVLRLNLCGVRDAAGHHLTAPAATPAIVGGGQHWAMVRNLTLYLVKLSSPPVPNPHYQILMLSFQRVLLRAGALLGAFLFLTLCASAQIVFTVNATATSTGLAYTSGNAYSFTFTLNDYSPTTPNGSALSNNQYNWSEDSTSHPILFSNIGGASLSGTYTRPTDPSHAITVMDKDQGGGAANRLMLSAVIDSSDSGLTFVGGGEGLYGIQMEATYTGLIFDVTNDGTPPDPYTYFSAYLGTYTAASTTSNTFALDDVNFTQVGFTINSLTISAAAVPEPSTYAAIFGLLALGFAGWRKRRKAVA